MNLKSGAMDQFKQFSQFPSLSEFNHHIEMWLAEHKRDFSKGELVGLKRLVRYAAKIPGVCHAKIGTLLKAIHEEYDGSGISRSTFKRMLGKAKDLGIITVHETERKNGSQSSNLYVFHSFPQNELPKGEKLNHPNETSNLSETKTNKELNKRNEEPFQLDHSFTSDRVPQPFVQLAKYFYPEARTIEEYWRMTKLAAYRCVYEKEKELVLETAIHSFKQLINKIKTKNIMNPIAYYFGILNKKFRQLYYQELYEIELEAQQWDTGTGMSPVY